MNFVVPVRLAARCRSSSEASDWLGRLPAIVRELQARWSLTISAPFDNGEVSCAWVAPVTHEGRTPAVLKVGMPHFEAAHEIAGLRFWDGDPTVRLLEADEHAGAMLLERCVPGTHLRRLRNEREQAAVVAALLRRLWRTPLGHSFRQLSALTAHWSEETSQSSAHWFDGGLVRDGLSLLRELPRTSKHHVLLATDLHAGNVLQAEREPWLVIDPKPFVGDPAFDATQHVLNSIAGLRADPLGTIQRFADLLEVDFERVRLWTFARLAAEPRDDWRENERTSLARRLAP
jgi:streptomycin 6-kinase